MGISPTRFARVEEAQSHRFREITQQFNLISQLLQAPDHTSLNRIRYPWVDFLDVPEIYGSRTWEYPWAITEAQLEPDMLCADIGCGMTPFFYYLENYCLCRVTGFDPNLDDGEHYYGHGVTREFVKRTGLHIVPAGIEDIAWWPSNYFDRIFCISVLEHLEPEVQRQGIKEMARILVEDGLALISIDIVEWRQFCNVPGLIEESGMKLVGAIPPLFPDEHFGIFEDTVKGNCPCDVLGIVLKKC